VRLRDFNRGWNGNYVYVGKHSYEFLSKSTLRQGDIVISNVGDPGVVFMVPELSQPMTLGPNSVLVKPAVNPLYFYRFLCGEYAQYLLQGITSGSAQRKFNKTELRNLQIPYPPMVLQARFDSSVSNMQTLMETLRQKNTILRQTRDLLLPRLISGELDVSGLNIKVGDEVP